MRGEGMKIDRKQLMDVLEKVKPGLAKNEVIEQSTHFIFDDNLIRTYNDEIAITHSFKSELQGAVSAKEFYGIFNKIPDDKITATDKGDGKFLFKGKKKQITFKIDSHISIPRIKVKGMNSKEWMSLPDDFSDAVKFCIFSASKNSVQGTMTGILVDGKYAVSCDNYRATKVKMKSEVDEPLLIPAHVAVDLVKYNVKKYYFDTNWMHFINAEKTAFSCRRMEGKYRQEVFDIFRVKGKKTGLPEELVEILDRSKVIVTGELDYDKFVTITLKEGQIDSVGVGPAAKIEEQTETKYKGKDLSILVQPDLIMEIMKHLKEVIIGESHLLFKSGNIEHVILLMSGE
jgi:DNA polymerase III sliding clamp (beta) subunit (PCNA family)